MMARSTNARCKGRIQMRKTNPLHLFTFGLHRTAGPYTEREFPTLGYGLSGCGLRPISDANGTSVGG
jgi:hypothetical protein